MAKSSFILGAAAGYVLGARAGRARYEQIKRAADKAWSNPKVQSTVEDLEGKAAATAKSGGAQLSDKVVTAAKGAVSTAQQKVTDLRHGEDDPAPTNGTAGFAV